MNAKELAVEVVKLAAQKLGVSTDDAGMIAAAVDAVEELLQERIAEIGDLRGNVIE